MSGWIETEIGLLPPTDPALYPPAVELGVCRWFALCDQPADGVVAHRVLGHVPTCERCATRLGLELVDPATLAEVTEGVDR